MKVRDVIREIEADGWKQKRQRGSHRIYQHATKSSIVVVAGHPGDDMAEGTYKNILKQAGLKQ